MSHREPKFRAWDKKNRVMIQVGMIDFDDRIIETDDGREEDKEMIVEYRKAVRFDDLEFIEYTGLKDRHGKEIYEGDILKSKAYAFTLDSHDTKECLSVVKFQDGCFSAKLVTVLEVGGIPTSGYLVSRDLSQCETIGNMYENSELIK